MWSNILDRISFWSFFTTVVLLPIFFLPFTKIQIENAKGLLLVIGLSISIVFWAAARFTDGKIILPKSWLLLSGFGIFFSVFLSALFSGNFSLSFFGIMLDLGTVSFMLCAFLLMFFSSIILMDRKGAQIVFLGILASISLGLLLQAIRFLAPGTITLGQLGVNTENLIGSWHSFGLIATLLSILSIFGFEFFSFSKTIRYVYLGLGILGIVLTASVNFALGWILLGIFALIIFVFKVAFTPLVGKEEEKVIKFPIFPFAVILVSLLFFMSGQFIGGYLNSIHITKPPVETGIYPPSSLWLANTEATPPSFASTTFSIIGKSFKEDPVFGIGPNRFSELWAKHKPVSINNTAFWSFTLPFGSGLLLTLIATTGALGALAWIIFLILFILYGIKVLFSKIKADFKWEVMVFFLGALYLFISSIFYSGGVVMLLLAFIFTGIFIGLSSYGKGGEKITISLLNNPKKSFLSIFVLVVLMVAIAGACFKYLERFASIGYYRAVESSSTVEEAEKNISKALSFYQNDLYWRTYSQIYFLKLQPLISKVSKNETLSTDEENDFRTFYVEATNGANFAIKRNPNNPLNFEVLATVHSAVVPFGVKDAYESAIDAYSKASLLDPLNPQIKLQMANISISAQKIKEAKAYAEEALSLKGDYVDVLYLLSLIERSEGNQSQALAYAEQALYLLPEDKNLAAYVDSFKNKPAEQTKDKTEEKKKQ